MDYLFSRFPLIYLVQPLWRDEAFSVLLASKSPFEIISLAMHDFGPPPLYYILLHYWMKIAGETEVAVRLLSIILFLVLLYVMWSFAKKHLSYLGKYVGITALILTLANPMLVYYAFEARGYILLTVLTVLSTDVFLRKKWLWYVSISTAMLYTHPYAILLLFAHGLWLIVNNNKTLFRQYILSGISIFILYIPWIVAIYGQMKMGGEMWYFPVDSQLINSILGNMYIGYEGTPWFLWLWTERLSIVLIILFGLGYWKTKQRTMPNLLILWILTPLAVVLSMSYVRPLFVNRYLIYVTPSIVLLLVSSIYSIFVSTKYRLVLTFSIAVLSLWFMIWYAPFVQKKDYRFPTTQINTLLQADDVIVVEDPIYYLNVRYYADPSVQVYIYRPELKPIPQYLAKVLIPEDIVIDTLPKGPTIYVVTEEAGYETIKQSTDDNTTIQLRK